MSSRTAARWATMTLAKPEPCIFCQSHTYIRTLTSPASRNLAPFSRDLRPGSRSLWNREYSTRGGQRLGQTREQFAHEHRVKHYKLQRAEGNLAVEPNVADQIITEFESPDIKRDPVARVLDLVQKYKLEVEDITKLAIVTFRIDDMVEKRDKRLLSDHQAVAGSLLVGCSKLKDPLATTYILRAVNFNNGNKRIEQIASQFSLIDIRSARKDLEALAASDNPAALTLLGQLLENEGSRQKARASYEKAIEILKPEDMIYDEKAQFSLALPQTQPWNALGIFLLQEKDPESRQQAKEAFTTGALQADDPLSYYHLASFEEDMSGKGLQYMTKAAASGHTDAMYSLANFYMQINTNDKSTIDSSLFKDKILRRALKWITQFRPNSPRDLAREFFEVAAKSNHKPSMLEMVELSQIEGDDAKAIVYLKRMAQPPINGKTEQWPELVVEAKKRLTALRQSIPT